MPRCPGNPHTPIKSLKILGSDNQVNKNHRQGNNQVNMNHWHGENEIIQNRLGRLPIK